MPSSTVNEFPSTLGYTFGVPTPETGISAETFEQNDTVDVYEQKDNQGEVVEVVTFNPRSEITISGESTAALAAILGLKMTVANLVTTQVGPAAPAVGMTICRGVQYSKNRARNQTVRITATYYPLIAGP
jgi:hypothetical protein